MNLPELRNPFTQARIVSVNTHPADYHSFDLDGFDRQRGDSKFIMSRSELMKFAACPLRWLNGFEENSTDATEWGAAMDCLFLQPEAWDERFAVTPEQYRDEKTGELKDWNNNALVCKAWKAAQNGKQIISAKKHEEALNACAALFADARISDLTFKAARQVFVLAEYHDRATGITVPFKVLIDLVPHVENPRFGKILADFKTGRDALGHKWQKESTNRFYHVQAACYLDAYVAATDEDRCDFRHVISESVPPYQTGRRYFGAEALDKGREIYLHALEDYCYCLANNKWPDYERGNKVIDGWGIIDLDTAMLMRSPERAKRKEDEPEPRSVIETTPQSEPETERELVP